MARSDPTAHWDAAYAAGDEQRSWTQPESTESLEAITLTGAGRDAPIVDVGGGASRLAGVLVRRGYGDVTVLDLSRTALDLARSRLGEDAERVTWIVADVLAWQPAEHRYAVWHDRAVLHFLTGDAERAAYVAQLQRALAPGDHVIIATFAPDGPDRCSGLPVRRSSPSELAALLGDSFSPVDERRHVHRTPSGSLQPFSWLVARRDT